MERFDLARGPQKYGLGMKEIWEIRPEATIDQKGPARLRIMVETIAGPMTSVNSIRTS